MGRFEFSYNKQVKWVYWADKIDYSDIVRELEEYDELQVWYPKSLDARIEEEYGLIISLIEGNSLSFGDKTYSKSINLMNDISTIFKGFSKTRRYETNRATNRDDLCTRFIYPNRVSSDVESYVDYYNAFARTKGLGCLDTNKIIALIEADSFAIGIVSRGQEVLVSNAYILSKKMGIASLFTSSSLFRISTDEAQLIARANGYLHFCAMKEFKERGFDSYDLGGFYMGSDDVQKIRISQYKGSFGGELDEYRTGFSINLAQVRNVEKCLKDHEKRIQESLVVLYGYSSWGKYIEEKLKNELGVIPDCVIDNKLCIDNDVIHDESVLELYNPGKTFIIVTTLKENYESICKGRRMMSFYELGNVCCAREWV